jgi:acetyl/propionyl-CoA carboxylase alpha subunit
MAFSHRPAISYLHVPGAGCALGRSIESGQIGLFYDPMLAKLIVHAPTRDAAEPESHRALLERRSKDRKARAIFTCA